MNTLLLALLLMPTAELTPGDHACDVKVGERTRKYLAHVPKREEPPKAWPVVLVFHGGGSNPEQTITFTGMNDTADKHGFIVVYPAGTGLIDAALTFNAGNCCGRAFKEKVDEIAFVTALLDDLEQRVAVDTRRVYATGMSNGAMLTYLVADKLSDRIAAIAPVAGPMGTETCAPKQPVPIVHFHGAADEYAPFAGGIGRRSITKTNFYSVDHTLAQWRKANRCGDKPNVEELKPSVDDGTRVIRSTYTPAKGGAPIVLYKIDGTGHTWPGQESRFKALGATTKNLDANEVMWAFFEEHKRE